MRDSYHLWSMLSSLSFAYPVISVTTHTCALSCISFPEGSLTPLLYLVSFCFHLFFYSACECVAVFFPAVLYCIRASTHFVFRTSLMTSCALFECSAAGPDGLVCEDPFAYWNLLLLVGRSGFSLPHSLPLAAHQLEPPLATAGDTGGENEMFRNK